ncbi:MAG: T9SS type A sorting domain-containing protein [Bacteroidetes bacterium]|nr:T9SS type A sorting domain-containing protein [Bacteroidota bacterium]
MNKTNFNSFLLRSVICTWMILSPDLMFGETWTQKAVIPGGVRDLTVGFSIGNKGYVGTGYHHGLWYEYQDFWEWDPVTDVWTQKADFGGGLRYGAVGFSIGIKGYIGTGASPTLRKDLWEYDPAVNTWTQKTDFGGAPRCLATGFSIGTKGYIGLGTINGNSSGAVADYWEWEGDTASPNYNTWVQKSSFPGPVRIGAVGFVINSKGYIGTGSAPGGSVWLDDFWEWDQPTDTWTQRAAFGGGLRFSAAGFSLNGVGYIGTGNNGVNTNDLWAYDPTNDTWIQKLNFGGAGRAYATGFSIGNRGYIGMGFFFTWSANDFWEYCDTCTAVGLADINADDFKVWYDPVGQQIHLQSAISFQLLQLNVYDLQGKICLQKNIRIDAHQLYKEIFSATPGVYLIVVADAKNKLSGKIWVR